MYLFCCVSKEFYMFYYLFTLFVSTLHKVPTPTAGRHVSVNFDSQTFPEIILASEVNHTFLPYFTSSLGQIFLCVTLETASGTMSQTDTTAQNPSRSRPKGQLTITLQYVHKHFRIHAKNVTTLLSRGSSRE